MTTTYATEEAWYADAGQRMSDLQIAMIEGTRGHLRHGILSRFNHLDSDNERRVARELGADLMAALVDQYTVAITAKCADPDDSALLQAWHATMLALAEERTR